MIRINTDAISGLVTKTNGSDTRVMAALAVEQVIKKQRSLTEVLPEVLVRCDAGNPALLHELIAGTLRWWWRLSGVTGLLLQKPLKPKDFDLQCLIAVGLYQIEYTRVPEHAAVSETVNAAGHVGKPWAKKLINALLRRFLREKETLFASVDKDLSAAFSHPKWMLSAIKQDWPQHWRQILEANNQIAPLTLRINQQKMTTGQAIDALSAMNVDSVKTRSSPVGLIINGNVKIWQTEIWDRACLSVQDESAQLVGYAVPLNASMKVLDACAAPGGKTVHFLEIEPRLELLALDNQATRLERLKANLKRANLACRVKNADAADIESWWQGELYDLVLIDAPCSGSGVIRKHPDIKHLRHHKDIAQNVETQRRLLDKLWPVLKVGGKMLYCTCSIFRQENDHQSKWLLEQKTDATQIPLPSEYGLDIKYGRQRLPGVDQSDGFYYACFEKCPS